MLVRELRDRLTATQQSDTVLVFIRRAGTLEPDVVQVTEVIDVPSEDAFVLAVDLGE
jgi:hypothetical protein